MPDLSDDVKRFEAYQKAVGTLGRMFLDVHPESDFEVICDFADALIWTPETRQSVLYSASLIRTELERLRNMEASRA